MKTKILADFQMCISVPLRQAFFIFIDFFMVVKHLKTKTLCKLGIIDKNWLRESKSEIVSHREKVNKTWSIW